MATAERALCAHCLQSFTRGELDDQAGESVCPGLPQRSDAAAGLARDSGPPLALVRRDPESGGR